MAVYLDVDASVPVLILKIGTYVVHHGTLGIVRSLGRLGVPVYAMVEDSFSPIAMSHYLSGSFVRNTDDADAGRLLTDLALIAERMGSRAILIPTDDAAAIFVSEHASLLRRWFLLPPVPGELPRRLADKRDLHLLCTKIGIPCPAAVFPECERDVREFAEHAVFPVVVKAANSKRLPKNTRGVLIAHSAAQLLSHYHQAEDRDNPNLILQEYIPQSSSPHSNSEDWIFHGYCNPQTNCFVAFTGKKLRSFPAFAGITTLGIPAVNEALRHQTKKVLEAIGYAGIMDIDYRFDARDGQYKLLDFNPRIGMNFRMFEDDASLDVVRALHLDLTGRRVAGSGTPESRTFIVEPYDLIASVAYMRHNRLTLEDWRQTMKGRREFAWFSIVDPVPFVVMLIRLTLLMLARAARQSRLRGNGLWRGSPVSVS